MDQLREGLALHLLKTGSRWLKPNQFEAIVTMFLLFGTGAEFNEASAGVKAGRYAVDPEFLTHFYNSCPEPLKLALFQTFGLAWLQPAVFEPIFRNAWSLRSATTHQREFVAWKLETVLSHHPAHAEDYRDIILELLRSPRPELCTRGLYLVSYLDDVEPRELAYVRRRLSAAKPEPRMNALNGLCRWTQRHREVSPRVLEFTTSPEIREKAKHLLRSDPEKAVRTCAHFMLKALREYERATGAKPSRTKKRKRSDS